MIKISFSFRCFFVLIKPLNTRLMFMSVSYTLCFQKAILQRVLLLFGIILFPFGIISSVLVVVFDIFASHCTARTVPGAETFFLFLHFNHICYRKYQQGNNNADRDNCRCIHPIASHMFSRILLLFFMPKHFFHCPPPQDCTFYTGWHVVNILK